MTSNANHRVREACLICEGKGKDESQAPCIYCDGSGIVFARSGAVQEILLATGDCKIPLRKSFADAPALQKRFS
jgi:hypothetical protein